MSLEPRFEGEYSARQVAAAHRVLVDLGQVLGAYRDCLVVVGGWVPDLLLAEPSEPHVGSIDVDLALDVEKLGGGLYAELVDALLVTKRYFQAEQAFKLYTDVDLKDGGAPIRVDVDFLKDPAAKPKKNRPKLTAGFRPLDAEACGMAFADPESVSVAGQMIDGAENRVQLMVASIADFLVMKASALQNRDKPKDAYDICYCIDQYRPGIGELAGLWKKKKNRRAIERAMEILREKFASVSSFGPSRVVEFHQSASQEEREAQARRAFELVNRFLGYLK